MIVPASRLSASILLLLAISSSTSALQGFSHYRAKGSTFKVGIPSALHAVEPNEKRNDFVASLPRNKLVVSPSVAKANFARLGDEVNEAIAGGCEFLHCSIQVRTCVAGFHVCSRERGLTAP